MRNAKNLNDKKDNDEIYNDLKNDDEIKRKLKYYEKKENNYAPSTKDFYELNKDRYINEIKKKDKNETPKKSNKNKAQENINPNELDNKQIKSKSKENRKIPNSSAKKTRINRSVEKRPLKKNLNNLYKNEMDKDKLLLTCCDCGKKENNLINYCDNCRGAICSNCKKNHLLRNPNHNYNLNKLKDIEKTKNLDNKTKEDFISKNLSLDVCSKCNKPLDTETPSVCNNCGGGALCKDCTKNHNIKFPNHDIYNKKINEGNKPNKDEQNKDIKCSECLRNINNLSNNFIENCPECNKNLCTSCAKDHFTKNPNHLASKNIKNKGKDDLEPDYDNDYLDKDKFDNINNLNDYDNNKNKPKSSLKGRKEIGKKNNEPYENQFIKCDLCKNSMPFTNNKSILHCYPCQKNLCNNCSNIHNKENPSHKANYLETYIKNNDVIEYPNKCIKCDKNIDNNLPLLNCLQCKGNLCNKCINDHYREMPNHKISMIKLINPEIYNLEKDILGNVDYPEDLNNYENSDNCNIPLGEKYSENNQNLRPKNKYPKENKDKDKQIQIKDELQYPIINCSLCDKNIPVDNNKIMNYCNNCKGNLCKNCFNKHKADSPHHDINKVKIMVANNPDEGTRELPLLKCNQCNLVLRDKIDEPIQYCSTCKSNLCDKCGNEHYRTKLDHILSLVKFILPNQFNNDFNCNQCGKTLNNFDNYQKCNNCKINLCDECTENHNKRYPSHIIYNNKQNQPLNKEDKFTNELPTNNELQSIPTNLCIECDKLIPNNSYINYCYNCKGNLCNNCTNKHDTKYPNHNYLNNIKLISIKPEEDNKSLPLLKCNQCNKVLNNNQPIQVCSQCQDNLCDKCLDNHNKSNPDHKISSFKYILPKSFNNDLICNKCGTDLKNLDDYKNCDNCNIPLCNECGENHSNENPNHKLRIIRRVARKKKVEENHQESLIKCVDCDKIAPIENNNFINYCNNCKGKICNECKINHNNIYPYHRIHQIKTILINPDDEKEISSLECIKCNNSLNNRLNQPLQYCTQCKGILCNKCINNHDSKFPKHKTYFKIYSNNPFNNDSSKENNDDKLFNKKRNNDDDHKKDKYNNEKSFPIDKCILCKRDIDLLSHNLMNHCNSCEGNICNFCLENHKNNNPEHNLIDIELLNDFNGDLINKNEKCMICKDDIKHLNKLPLYMCKNCDGLLCNECGINHEKDIPNHKLVLVLKKKLSNKNDTKNNDSISNNENDINYPNNENKQIDNDNNNNYCQICGKKNRNICDNCKFNLCLDCFKNHQKEYPNHQIKNITQNINKNKDEQNRYNKKCRCLQCKKNINLNNHSIINYCNNCKDILCDKCKNIHYNKYPRHIQLNTKTNILENSEEEINNLPQLKCIVCQTNLANKINEPISNCYRCKGNLCEQCSRSHNREFPRHRIEYEFYIPTKNSEELENELISNENNFNNSQLIKNKKCIFCKKFIHLKENNSINHCKYCNGNICNKCLKIHLKRFASHKIIPLDIVSKNTLPHSNCSFCGKNISNNEDNSIIYNCLQCNGDLCYKCGNEHFNKKPSHKIHLKKYIFQKLDNNKENYCHCGKDLNSLESYQICENCNIYYCNDCSNNHKITYSNHNFRIINKANDIINNFNQTQPILVNCLACHNNMEILNNDEVNYCFNCKGILCNKCEANHNARYLNHNKKIIKINFINDIEEGNINNKYIVKCALCHKDLNDEIDQPIKYCNQCYGNICNQCENEHSKVMKNHNISLKKYIRAKRTVNISKLNCNKCGRHLEDEHNDNYNGKINHCNKCKINLCDDCIINHRKNHPSHTIRIIKRKIISSKVEDISNNNNGFLGMDKCTSCSKNITLRNNLKLNYCQNCKGILCDICKDLHFSRNPGHIILYPKTILFKEYENKDFPLISKLKCIICNTNLQNYINLPIDFCINCEGNLCKKCAVRHINEYPIHQSELKLYLPDNNKKIYYIQGYNCKYCGRKIKLINNEDINLCIECNGYICNNCDKQHNEAFPIHTRKLINIILIEKTKNNFEIPKLNCILCKKNLENQINNTINYCSNCCGNLCKECTNIHTNKDKKHLIKLKKYLFITHVKDIKEENGNAIVNENSNMDINKNKCILCKKKTFKNNEFIYCNNCMGILCEQCHYNHQKEFSKHNIFIKIYIPESFENNDGNSIKEEATICKLCSNYILNIKNNYCNICKFNLCEECSKIHYKEYPSHMDKININYEKKYNLDINNKKNNKLKLQANGDYCNTCGILIINKINISSHYCDYCEKSFCHKCINHHYKANPEHKPGLVKNISQPNISLNYLFLSSEKDLICNNCQKEINNNMKDSIFYCNQCKIKICKEFKKIHEKQFPTHNIIFSKNKLLNKKESENQIPKESNEINNSLINENENESKDKICSCKICKIPHSKYPTRLYYLCTDCNNYICSLCQKKHDDTFYSHILINPHKYGEEFKKIKKKIVHRRFASVGSERQFKNRDIGKEKINRIESMKIISNSRKNFCSKCKNISKKIQICNKCKRYYCQKCIKEENLICK